MLRFFIRIIGLVLMLLAATPVTARSQSSGAKLSEGAEKTILNVSLSGLRNNHGRVIFWVWNGPAGFPRDPSGIYERVAFDATIAKNGTLKAQFHVRPGTYAVTILHDENKNTKMDSNFLVIPTKGIGTSNNIRRMHAPSFTEACFTVSKAIAKKSIGLRYFF